MTRRSIVRYFPAGEGIAVTTAQFGHFGGGSPIAALARLHNIGRQDWQAGRQIDAAALKFLLSVTGVDAAPALFYGLAMNVTMMPLADRLLWSQRDGYDSGGGRQEA